MKTIFVHLSAAVLLFNAQQLNAQDLRTGMELTGGQTLWSPLRRYRLTMESNGNLVFYRASDGAVRWQTKTSGHQPDHTRLIMQTDGNAVLTYTLPQLPRIKGQVILYKPRFVDSYQMWYSNTSGNEGARLVPQDDGDLVVYSSNGTVLWGIGPDRSKQPAVVVTPPGGPPPTTLPTSTFLTCNNYGCQ